MRRHNVKAAAFMVGLGLLGQGRWAMTQETIKEAPPAPLHVGSDLPPLPEPVSAPPATGTTPASFPSPVAVDSQPVTPPAAPAAPPSSSGFATTPRSNEPAPGRPPAFRLLVPGQPTLNAAGPAVFRPDAPPVETTQSRYPSVTTERPPEIPVVTGAQTPVVTLEKRGPASIALGQPLIYEIVVRNAGVSAAQQVRVEDVLPAGTSFLSAEPAATVQGERLVWVLESLAPGAERHFKVTVQPANEGEWIGSASVLVATSSSLRTRVLRASMTLTMTGPESVAVGQPAVFQIHVSNASNQPLVGLVLRDRLPPGLQHAAGTELEADLGTVEPGKTKNITLTTKAIQAGRATNSALVTTTDGQQVEARATVQVIEAPRPPH